MAAWSDLPKAGRERAFVGILKLGVAMIQCILSSSWTGYMLVEVWHDFSEVGFVEVSRDDGGSVRVFIDVAAELVVEFGQSQASICLWWNVNGSNDDRCKLPGQIEWAADNGEMFQMR